MHADEMLEYSKRTKKWVVKPIAEHKQHDYLLDMMEDVIKLRLHGRHEDTTDIDTPIAKDINPRMHFLSYLFGMGKAIGSPRILIMPTKATRSTRG